MRAAICTMYVILASCMIMSGFFTSEGLPPTDSISAFGMYCIGAMMIDRILTLCGVIK